jgi:anti-anti-sigma factor
MSSNSHTASLISIDAQRVGPHALLPDAGEGVNSSSADWQRALETARDGGATDIWLDLARTTFMDCSGLRALLNLRAHLHDANRRLVVICPAEPVLRLLVLTGVDRELEIYLASTAAQ